MSADEAVDIVDPNDVVIGCASRREVSQGNLRHRSVYILVFSSTGKLLIHRRTATKDIYPGYWDVAFGGVLGAGEGYDSGARRELEEECGVRGVELQSLFHLDYQDAGNQVSAMVYRCRADGPFHLQAAEVVTIEWVELDALPRLAQTRRFCPDGLVALRRFLALPAAAKNDDTTT